MTKEVICVLGMHRSGTSLLCEILQNMGVFFGTKEALVAGDQANPDGYFELKELAGLLPDIDADARKTPLDPSWFDINKIPPQKKERYCEQIYQCLFSFVRRCPENQIFAIKHPGICVLLPWFNECFAKMKVTVRYIVIVRNPLETAQSLWRRDCYPIDFGLHLWEKHNAAILAYAELRDTLFLDYQMLFDDFAAVYHKIADFIHCEEDAYARTKDLINPDYRHHEVKLEDYKGKEDLQFLKKIYGILLRFCNMDGKEEIKRIAAETLEQYFLENQIFQETHLEYLNFYQRKLSSDNRQILKYKTYYNFLLRWIKEKSVGNSIEKCLLQKNIKKIAIYGMGEIGKIVYAELRRSNICVTCLIDQNPDFSFDGGNIVLAKPEETEKYVNTDIILVTSIASYQDIKYFLLQKNITNVMSLNSLW